MPGILPMKVIKVGNSSQSRVAQACDRCRSKKIRCDGIRPCCSQCANVGFECKTSDKLSRRAFPRGYTESLEDRVRALEAEVRELKALLDEKDEKIDVLSRLHSMAPPRKAASPALTDPTTVSSTSSPSENAHSPPASDRDDLIHVEHSTSLLRKPTQDAPFTGPSSTKAFIDAFSHKLETSGKSSSTISIEKLLSPPSLSAWERQDAAPKTPPRLVSDQLLNIYLQEWAPFYPVVHRPTILKLYDQYTTNPDSIERDNYASAHLNLIFGIAAVSSTSRVPQDPAFFERRWISKLNALTDDVSLSALQCYILAQIYYLIKSDYKSVLRYRGIAVALCYQLGLHQSQKRFSFNRLITETRKRVFWCQYVLDRFAAALTGLPVLVAESDICTEYPTDVDDENVTETGFVPTPPEETTRMSSAIALFNVSRILNRVLEELYPSPAGYKISLSAVHSLAEELDDWQKKLPSHLRLEFAQDKPSTNVTGSRSPLLSVAYYFIRTLIRRPAVCYGKPETSSPSMLSLVDSAKHMIQLLKLLEERRMSLSIAINKRELIFIAGLSLLWQTLDLNPDSKLVKEGQKSLLSALTLLECEAAEAAAEFGAIISMVSPSIEALRRNSTEDAQLSNALAKQKSSPKRHFSLKARLPTSFDPESGNRKETSRRATMAGSASDLRSAGRPLSSHSACPHPAIPDSRPHTSTDQAHPHDYLKLDFLGDGRSDWEHVLSSIENGHSNIYTGIYGGSEAGETPVAYLALNGSTPSLQPPQTQPQRHQPHRLSAPSLPTFHLPQSLGGATGSTHDLHDWTSENWSATVSSGIQPAHSVVSYSEESLASTDDLPPGDLIGGNHHHPPPHHSYQPQHQRDSRADLEPIEGIMIPHTLDAMDGNAEFGVPDGSWVPQCVI
ncbi:hypothetical protein VTO42DRAFT_7752 [Malbranchea cinnamomea]